MSRFFPPALTSERIGEIIVFKQGKMRVSTMHRRDTRDC